VKTKGIVFALISSLFVALAGCSLGDVNESVYFQDIYPNTDNTYDLGSSTYSWDDAYIEGTIYSGIGRDTTFTVAASNASSKSIAQADYICDGVDDTVTIQQAVDALPASGGSIVLSEGTFYVTANTGLQLSIHSNTILEGQGSATVLEAISGGNCIVQLGGTIVENIIVRDFVLGSSGTADCDGIGVGSGVGAASSTTICNILVENIHSLSSFPKSTVDIGHSTMTALDIFYNVIVRGIIHDGGDQQAGISLVAPAKTFTRIGGFWIEDCYIYSPYNDGILVEGAVDDLHISNNVVLSPGRYAIAVEESGVYTPKNIYIDSNSLSGMSAAGSAGIYVYGCNNIHITNNNIISAKYVLRFGSSTATTNKVWVIGNSLVTSGANCAVVYGEKQVTNLVIANNYLETTNYYPIRLTGAGGGSVLVTGNVGVETAKDGTSFCRCDNTIVGKVSNNIYNQRYFTEGTGLQQLDNAVIDGATYYKTANSGTATIASGSTSIVVSHGLVTTPTRIIVTPRENPTNAVSFWWVDTLTTTQFTINVNTDPGASNLDFDWRAVIGEGN
jgi:hypothetical protein